MVNGGGFNRLMVVGVNGFLMGLSRILTFCWPKFHGYLWLFILINGDFV